MAPSSAFDYARDELDAMACARNYYRWILDAWRPHLGRVVLEFGAGIGTFSAHLLREPIERPIVSESCMGSSKTSGPRCGTRASTRS